MLEMAQHVHLPLGVVRRIVELAAQARARAASQSGASYSVRRVEQLVEQDRMAREIVGRPRAGAGQLARRARAPADTATAARDTLRAG